MARAVQIELLGMEYVQGALMAALDLARAVEEEEHLVTYEMKRLAAAFIDAVKPQEGT